MNLWRPYPLLRLVMPFLAGILAALLLSSRSRPDVVVTGLVLLLLFFLALIPRSLVSYRYRWVFGIFTNIFVFLAAFQLTQHRFPENDPFFFGNVPDGTFLAVVAEPPSIKPNYVKTILRIQQRRDSGTWEPAKGKALVYLRRKGNNHQLQFGDRVLLHLSFQEISDNSNPHSFRYAGFLKGKGITHQSFVAAENWTTFSAPSPFFFRRFAFQARDRLLDILRDNGVTGKEFAVASALLLGYVQELDDALRNDYAATGAMHILSVSGMHVGIIYLFLEFVLLFLDRSRTGRFLKMVILLLFIWFYAFLTGLSPCVLRAAAMLSLPIIGKVLNRPHDMLNILSASLVLILIVDPLLVMDIGFQLSYLAMMGIVFLYRPVYGIFTFTSWLPDKIWAILAVSIAAQIATLPVSLYNFHQFPNYFMVTNLFVVPLSSLIIYTGILTLALGPLPFLSFLLAKILSFLIWLLNSVIHFIEQLPCSTLRGIYPGVFQMFLMYAVIVAGFLMLTTRRAVWAMMFLATLLVLNLLYLHFQLGRLSTSRFIVYNSGGTLLYQFGFQDRAIIFYDHYTSPGEGYFQRMGQIAGGELDARGNRLRYFCLDRRGKDGVVIPAGFDCLARRGIFYQFYGKRIAVLREKFPRGFHGKFALDYLVLSGNPAVTLKEAMAVFHPEAIVLDGTNSGYRIKKWLEEGRALHIECHSVREDGAFERDL